MPTALEPWVRRTPLILAAGLALGSSGALLALVIPGHGAGADPASRHAECEIAAAAAASLTADERGGAPVLTLIGDPDGRMPYKPLGLAAGANREALDCAAALTAMLTPPSLTAETRRTLVVRMGRVARSEDGATAQVVADLPRQGRLLTLVRQDGHWRRTGAQDLWSD